MLVAPVRCRRSVPWMGFSDCPGLWRGAIAAACTAHPALRDLRSAEYHALELVPALRTQKREHRHSQVRFAGLTVAASSARTILVPSTKAWILSLAM